MGGVSGGVSVGEELFRLGQAIDSGPDAEVVVLGVARRGAGVLYPTNTSTNRLTAHPYDNSGAMTSWSGHVDDREDLGLVWRTTMAGWKYIHIYTSDDERVWTFFEAQNRSRWTLRDLDGQVLREFDTQDDWHVQRDYVYRDGVPLATVLPTSGHIHHLHPDHLGTHASSTMHGITIRKLDATWRPTRSP